MIHVCYSLTCDSCNKRRFSDGDESEGDLRSNASAHGWTFRKVPNGSVWDLCPTCSQLKTEALP